MKIYFAGSIRGGRQDAELYLEIIEYLKKYGEVLTEHVGDQKLTSQGEGAPSDVYVHDRDIAWLLSADAIIAEVTTASLGVGYEIGRAMENGKKVLCLFRPQSGRKLSAMIGGAKLITNREYSSLKEAQQVIDDFFQVRLCFSLSPPHPLPSLQFREGGFIFLVNLPSPCGRGLRGGGLFSCE